MSKTSFTSYSSTQLLKMYNPKLHTPEQNEIKNILIRRGKLDENGFVPVDQVEIQVFDAEEAVVDTQAQTVKITETSDKPVQIVKPEPKPLKKQISYSDALEKASKACELKGKVVQFDYYKHPGDNLTIYSKSDYTETVTGKVVGVRLDRRTNFVQLRIRLADGKMVGKDPENPSLKVISEPAE